MNIYYTTYILQFINKYSSKHSSFLQRFRLNTDAFTMVLETIHLSDTFAILESQLCLLWIKWSISNENEKSVMKQWFYQKFSVPGGI